MFLAMSRIEGTKASDAVIKFAQNPDEGEDSFDSKRLSTTPPSSPPVNMGEVTGMPSPRRKRSHDDVHEEGKDIVDSSATIVSDVRSSAVQDTLTQPQVNPSATLQPRTPAGTMAPPPIPVTFRSTQQPPQSGRGGRKPRETETEPTPVEKDATSIFTTSDTNDGRSGLTSVNEVDLADSTTVEEPHERVEDFDWDDLHIRYHRTLQAFREREQAILGEFNSLCEVGLCSTSYLQDLTWRQYFGVWANAIDKHEADRSFKRYSHVTVLAVGHCSDNVFRLKMQTAYVRHEEEELEQKRVHCTISTSLMIFKYCSY